MEAYWASYRASPKLYKLGITPQKTEEEAGVTRSKEVLGGPTISK